MGGISAVVRGYMDAGLFDRVPIEYVATHIDGNALTKLQYAFGAYVKLFFKLIARQRILLHVHLSTRASFWRKWPIFCLARVSGRPYIVHLHGGRFMTFYQDELGRFGRARVRSVFDNAALVLALSPTWQGNIAQFSSNSNIVVLPNAVPVPGSHANKDDTGKPVRMLFLGRLGRNKGIYDILSALAELHDRIDDFELIAAGDGEIDKVRYRAQQLGLQQNVVTPGWIDPARKAEVLRSSHIFLLPSYAEGMPMSLLEAMAAGLAIVSSTVGGIPLAIANGKEGILIAPGNVPALRDALLLLVTDPKVRSSYGQRAYERAKTEFSLERNIDRLIGLYAGFGIEAR